MQGGSTRQAAHPRRLAQAGYLIAVEIVVLTWVGTPGSTAALAPASAFRAEQEDQPNGSARHHVQLVIVSS